MTPWAQMTLTLFSTCGRTGEAMPARTVHSLIKDHVGRHSVANGLDTAPFPVVRVLHVTWFREQALPPFLGFCRPTLLIVLIIIILYAYRVDFYYVCT